MAGKEQAEEWFRKFSEMTLDQVAIAAGANESTYSRAAQIEIELRVAKAQIKAAEAQEKTAWAQRVTAWGTLGLIGATLIVALVTYLAVAAQNSN